MVTKEKQAEYNRTYYQKPGKKEAARRRQNARRAENREKYATELRRWRLGKMGLTEATAAAMRAAQDNQCAICAVPMTTERGPHMACLDHSHETGLVRGYLCNKCNRALGLFQDNLENLRRAADYLEKAQCR
jgi:hypothetical protein